MVRDETSLTFLRKSLEMLQMSIDQYGRLPRGVVIRIQNVIEELEDIIEEEC